MGCVRIGLIAALCVAAGFGGCRAKKRGSSASTDFSLGSDLPSVEAPASSPNPARNRAPQTPRLDRERALLARARDLARRFVIIDGHIDVPYRLEKSRDAKGQLTEDISRRTPQGDFDFERARQGGLDAPFMSIYVPPSYEKGGAKKLVDKLIDLVQGLAKSHPDKFALARSPAEVRKNAASDKISLAMGMENGSPIEHNLGNVTYFHERGIRYITLAHSKDNHIADSSYDERQTNNGLSQFGKRVVAEMNRVGVMIDVSHISDRAFWQVMDLSRAPVVASHSSCRRFTPGWLRNMSDPMIQRLAKSQGVIQINFGSSFIDPRSQKEQKQRSAELLSLLKKSRLDSADPRAKRIADEFRALHPIHRASVEQVADHIAHVVALVGIAHVGIGSDFDGVGDTLPNGLKDVSEYPNLIRVLLERGYSERNIEAICSGNVLRVWQAVEDLARPQTRGL